MLRNRHKLVYTMEITAPHRNSTFIFPHFYISPTKHSSYLSYKNGFSPTQIRLPPLHKPIYKPPKPIKPKKANPKPIVTSSDILHLMDSLKLPITLDIYISLIKECIEMRNPSKAIELHVHMKKNRVRLSLPMLNRVLLMYVSSGCFENARQLFDQMPVTDFYSWAVVIAGSVENGEFSAAENLFANMLSEQKFENLGDPHYERSVCGILICVLRGCLGTLNLEFGRQVHCWLWKMGYSRNVVLSSFLIYFYGKLKCLEEAQTVFEHASVRNTVVWTSMIVNNCCSDENFEEVVSLFIEMGMEGVRKNAYTFSSVLKACSKKRDVLFGQQVHANVVKLGLVSHGFVQCALVDFYGKCGSLNDAKRFFEGGGKRRKGACYNALLANYEQHGLYREAMQILDKMKLDGLKANDLSLSEETKMLVAHV